MHRDHPRPPLLRLLAVLFALVLAAAACGDDDDDDSGSASGSGSASEADADGDGDDAEDAEPLSPEEARAAGTPEVYERIASTEDCAKLADEHEAHQSNADGYFADDPERGPIFQAYADAAKERMEELNCPENAGETTTSTTAPQ
jgi:hypothetical protein